MESAMANGHKRQTRKIFLIVVIMGIIALSYWAYASIFRRDNSIPDNKLAKISRGNLARSVVATGKIQPLAKIEVKSKASGIIKYLYADESDTVKAGQILVELDKELIEAQLRESEASLLATKAGMQQASAQRATALAELSQLRIDLETLERQEKLAQREYNRRQELYKQALLSLTDMDAMENQLIEAQQKVKSLKSQVHVKELSIEAAAKAVLRSEAEVAQAEAAVERYRENLRYTTIRAPIDGLILSRQVEVGDAVSSILQLGSNATLIMNLADITEVFVEGRVDENDIGKVQIGQAARISVDTYRDRQFDGKVIRISPLGVEKDNVIGFKVKVSINNDTRLLRVNMSANAEIVLEEKKDVLRVPEAAIIYDKDKSTFVEIPDKTADRGRRQVPVKLGIGNGTYTELLQGLKETDLVVLQ
jgi:HlyD family secretion protein